MSDIDDIHERLVNVVATWRFAMSRKVPPWHVSVASCAKDIETILASWPDAEREQADALTAVERNFITAWRTLVGTAAAQGYDSKLLAIIDRIAPRPEEAT